MYIQGQICYIIYTAESSQEQPDQPICSISGYKMPTYKQMYIHISRDGTYIQIQIQICFIREKINLQSLNEQTLKKNLQKLIQYITWLFYYLLGQEVIHFQPAMSGLLLCPIKSSRTFRLNIFTINFSVTFCRKIHPFRLGRNFF